MTKHQFELLDLFFESPNTGGFMIIIDYDKSEISYKTTKVDQFNVITIYCADDSKQEMFINYWDKFKDYDTLKFIEIEIPKLKDHHLIESFFDAIEKLFLL